MRRFTRAKHLHSQVSNSKDFNIPEAELSKLTARQRGCFLLKYQTSPPFLLQSFQQSFERRGFSNSLSDAQERRETSITHTAAVAATKTDTGLQAAARQIPARGLLECVDLSPSSRVPPILIFGRTEN